MSSYIGIDSHVVIADVKSYFFGMTGVVASLFGQFYVIALDDRSFKIKIHRDGIKKSSDNSTCPILDNIYRRYAMIKIQTLSDVLRLLLETSTNEEAYNIIVEYIHNNAKKAVDSPLDIIGFLPNLNGEQNKSNPDLLGLLGGAEINESVKSKDW